MTPTEFYQKKCEEGVIREDPEQLIILGFLERIYHELLTEQKKRSGIFSLFRKKHPVKGLYVWGGVGIGKTFLMDCFFQSLPFPQKMRLHFHSFMKRVHAELKKHQGEVDPLVQIANQLAKETMVVCFDEFYVSDITDAMLLGRLFKYLFLNGVTLIATSNTAPDHLYKKGLQRDRFIPAIELIKKHTEVLNVPTRIDYRLQYLKEAGVFYTPLDEAAKIHMEKTFNALTQGEETDEGPIEINGRLIAIRKKTAHVIWFNFKDICSVPRSQNDYLEIASQFKIIFISDIPVIPHHDKDRIHLFISLVDVFYDARVRLVISAEQPIENLYNRGHMILEYTRTHSRLLQMQSTDYFAGEIDHIAQPKP